MDRKIASYGVYESLFDMKNRCRMVSVIFCRPGTRTRWSHFDTVDRGRTGGHFVCGGGVDIGV